MLCRGESSALNSRPLTGRVIHEQHAHAQPSHFDRRHRNSTAYCTPPWPTSRWSCRRRRRSSTKSCASRAATARRMTRPTPSTTELAKLIQRDVALAGQVMRVANSALYARRTPVVTLPQAIAWLGMREIRTIAFAVAVQGQVFASTYFRNEMADLWRESVITALFAQEIARLKRRNVESAYLCGLLHRVGMAVILAHVGAAVVKHRLTPDSAQVMRLAARHEARVGTQLAISWQLPPAVSAAIAHWRDPPAAEMSRTEVMEVALARQISDELRTPGARRRTAGLHAGAGIAVDGRAVHLPGRAVLHHGAARRDLRHRGKFHVNTPAAAETFDVVVIGSGPAGQKAAIQAAKAGKRVAVIERDRQVGGSCVHTGTIPSKSLREHALRQRVRRVDLMDEPIQSLLDGVGATIAAHDTYMAAQLERNHITLLRGRASFTAPARARPCAASTARSPRCTRARHHHRHGFAAAHAAAPRRGPRTRARQRFDPVAGLSAAQPAGARRRRHRQRIRRDVRRARLQGDAGRSIRTAAGLPRSRAHRVLCRRAAPQRRRVHPARRRCRRRSGMASRRCAPSSRTAAASSPTRCWWRWAASPTSTASRSAPPASRSPAAATSRWTTSFETTAPGVYAAGDVIGPPALASVSMEQGRRAACHALGLLVPSDPVSRLPSRRVHDSRDRDRRSR